MPRYYKRGALGRMIEAEGGSSDPELAEVRMTDEEYWDLWDQIRSSKRVAESALAEGEISAKVQGCLSIDEVERRLGLR